MQTYRAKRFGRSCRVRYAAGFAAGIYSFEDGLRTGWQVIHVYGFDADWLRGFASGRNARNFYQH